MKLLKPRTMRWTGYMAHVGEKRHSYIPTYGVLVEKPVGKSPLGRARRRWESKVQMKLKRIE
jgi:hypothetical protein